MYHVAPSTYNAGEHIYSRTDLIAMGYDVAYKWDQEGTDEQDYPDGDFVSMFERLGEAEEYLTLWLNGDGIILEIDDEIMDDERPFQNAEGYWMVNRIDASYII